ncbi:uncharacterized protein VP01_2047g2 [Puccinia sorghi]|uniref:Uncharacterized protein n=1 Tax=Puccinia sorghi TaxID=27349 RepID=A0A0L6VBH0_9BASI|nr:uncharacterized protein VP01_2047g2 [Puccinia sorghi]
MSRPLGYEPALPLAPQLLATHCLQHGLYDYLSPFSPADIPTDPTLLKEHNRNLQHTAGILHQAMGTINYQHFITPDNIKNPSAIWSALTNYYESNSDQNQNTVYRDFITSPYYKDITTFLDDVDAKLSNLASVGLIVGEPKEAHTAQTILQNLPEELSLLHNILFQSKTPLTIASVKEALDSKHCQTITSGSSTNPSIKQETTFKALWPTCRSGWHNPKNKQKAEDCVQAKLKAAKSGPLAKAAVDKLSDTASVKSISTASGMVVIRRALAVTVVGEGEPCFLEYSGASHHIYPDQSSGCITRSKTGWHLNQSRAFIRTGMRYHSNRQGYIQFCQRRKANDFRRHQQQDFQS